MNSLILVQILEESVDYPDFAHKLANEISTKNLSGVLFVEVVWECQWLQIDTKMSEQLLCFNENMAKLSRQHNDANILVLGSRLIS